MSLLKCVKRYRIFQNYFKGYRGKTPGRVLIASSIPLVTHCLFLLHQYFAENIH